MALYFYYNFLLVLCVYQVYGFRQNMSNFPIVVTTWPFINATSHAWNVLSTTNDSMLAVEMGCHECELTGCHRSVGYGGSPDESAETTLDALIMDGSTLDAGAVGGLKRIRSAISVARAVMKYTKHTFLVGEAATKFAVQMGFKQEETHSVESMKSWINWYQNKCQPNYRQNVTPDPTANCGAYTPYLNSNKKVKERYNKNLSKYNHDTIGMIAIDSSGNIAGGVSSNGLPHKIPGRVGDSSIIGSGVYVDNDVGGACATGDGDVMMRFVPSYQAVEFMRNGKSPSDAAKDAIQRIVKFYPYFPGAIVAVDKNGNHGAACNGMDKFHYSIRDKNHDYVYVVEVKCC